MTELSPPCCPAPSPDLSGEPYDLLVIGGGINGAAIARAAAIAGRRVLLVEQGDLAQATSSASTKLMHGGLRYLEHYQFKLVREALAERALMLRNAPHLVRPLEFRLPHVKAMRPWWLVRAGLYLYDLFARNGGLPRSRAVRLDDSILKPGLGTGFAYWDGWVDDSRLVVLNALDAAESGADIRTRTRFVFAERQGPVWWAELDDGDRRSTLMARMIVNAAGPWVERVLGKGFGRTGQGRIRLVRGSHLIVRRRMDDRHAWILQQPDGRIIFIIPYLGDLMLIGTTDMPVEAPDQDRISAGERAYLLDAANRYLQQPVTAAEIIGDFAGIRPLFDDGKDAASAVTRDYRLELDDGGPPLLSVFGGKITTARHLADVAVRRLGILGGDTDQRPLPGGNIPDMAAFRAQVRQRWPFLSDATATRMENAYGSRIFDILGAAKSVADLGRDLGHGLSEREVSYLVRVEWARSADDILFRRSKLGLRFTADQAAELSGFVEQVIP